jgi:hypothetical protein
MTTVNFDKQKKIAQEENDWDLDWVEQLPFYAAELHARIKKEKVEEGWFRYTVIGSHKGAKPYLVVESSRDIKSFFRKPTRSKNG